MSSRIRTNHLLPSPLPCDIRRRHCWPGSRPPVRTLPLDAFKAESWKGVQSTSTSLQADNCPLTRAQTNAGEEGCQLTSETNRVLGYSPLLVPTQRSGSRARNALRHDRRYLKMISRTSQCNRWANCVPRVPVLLYPEPGTWFCRRALRVWRLSFTMAASNQIAGPQPTGLCL